MSDYDRIAQAIAYLVQNVRQQPSLEDIAAHVHLSPFHFQRLFSRWVGVTPKRFLQTLTVERAKQLLEQAQPLLDVSHALGLSSSSRLYDHFIHLEAVTPGEYKSGGEGLAIAYGEHDSPFGSVFVAMTAKGICNLAFVQPQEVAARLAALRRQWPQADIREDIGATGPVVADLFKQGLRWDKPLSLHVAGTNFQVNVWKALLQIPPGAVASYGQVAAAVGNPAAARAVGLAVGKNPVALLIPCHRVIRQSGEIGGYHWGDIRKHAIHAWESARWEST